ncbi:MAG TPA: hypothetical protein VN732_04580, partial [Solirubrobacterales bacterium]|nr:hypothetical protein [Solirubrobacterales bacterium]
MTGPQGIGVDGSTGDIYVADRNNFRIDRFDPTGEFLLAWGVGVRDGVTPVLQTCGPAALPPSERCFEGKGSSQEPGAISPEAVAVDGSADVVYVAGNNKVTAFTGSGELLFILGRNVNITKGAEADATQAEKNICTVVSGDVCGAAESGAGPNEFSDAVRSMVIDSAGVVWVGDTERLTSFDATGTAGAQIALPGAGATRSLALDSADNFYVVSELLAGVRRLEAGTGTLVETLDATGFPRSVTVDAADNVYVGDCGDSTAPICPSYHFKVYNASGEQSYGFGAGQVIGSPDGNSLAVDEGAERLYVASSRSASTESAVQAFPLPEPGPLIEAQGVEEVLPTTATLVAEINPEGDETTYHFDYGTSASYGQSSPAETLPGVFGSEDVSAGLENLIPGTTYHFQLVATNHCNPAEPTEECEASGEDQAFTTLPAINIISQSATNVTATTAILHGEMDPLGVEAEAWIEYGTSEAYGQKIALANLGAGFGAVARQASLGGLQPGTAYHFRFVGRDKRDGTVYTVAGPDRTFATQRSGIGFELPDERAWEMVSPPDKHGAILTLNTETSVQASADGSGLVYSGSLPIDGNPEGFREFSTILGQREPGGTWHSKDLTTPNAKVAPLANTNGAEYKLFNPDLSEALLEPRSGTPLSIEASERTPYWRLNSEPPQYRPLVTDKEGFANVPPGTGFGGEANPSRFLAYVRVQAATPDLRHVVLKSEI